MPRNILIDPQRLGTGNPNIQFSGSMANTIRLEVLTSGSIQFAGVSGSLLSVVDSLSGSLFAVSDVSGLPILEAFSDDRVVMGRYNTNALVVTGSRVGIGTSSPSDILDVNGSINIALGSSYKVGSSGVLDAPGNYTRIISPGTSLSTQGTQVLAGAGTIITTFTSNGNVGVGTTNPSARLHITGSSTSSDQTLLVRAGTPNQSGPVLEVENNLGTTLLVVSGSGFVGVGTTNPGSLFTVSRNLINGSVYTLSYVDGQTFGSTAAGSGLVTAYGSNSGVWAAIGGYSNGTAAGLGLWAAASTGDPNVYINSTGNVGIGTTGPTAGFRLDSRGSIRVQVADPRFDLVGTYRQYITQVVDGASAAASYWRLYDQTASAGRLHVYAEGTVTPGADNVQNLGDPSLRWRNIYATSISGSLTGSNVSAGQVVVAGTGGVLSGSNNFWWDNAGQNVGIGTNSPLAKLDVRGSLGIGGGVTYGNGLTVTSTNSSAANHTHYFRGPATGTNDDVYFDLNRGGGAYGSFRVVFNSSLIFGVAGGGLIYNGNILMQPISNVQISTGKLSIGGATPVSQLEVTGSGNTSSTSTMHLVNGSNTSLMFVRNDGNVGIGATNPTARLQLGSAGSGVTKETLVLSSSNPGYFLSMYVKADSNDFFAFEAGGVPFIKGYATGEPLDLLYNYGFNFKQNAATSPWVTIKNGNLGVRATNPQSRLEVTGSGNTSSTSTMHLLDSSNSSLMFVRDDARTSFGTSSPGNSILTAQSTAATWAGLTFKNSAGTTGGSIGLDAVGSGGGSTSVSVTSVGTLTFGSNNAAKAQLDTNGNFTPYTNLGGDLGTNSLRWKDIYARTGSFSGDVSISGNLTVLGVQTYVSSTVVDIGDNIITLNSTANPQRYGGLYVNDTTAGTTGSLLWDSDNNYWVSGLKGSEVALPTGTGTSGLVTRWTGTNTLGTGVLYDNGTNVGIGDAPSTVKLFVRMDSTTAYTDTGFNTTALHMRNGTGGLSSVSMLQFSSNNSGAAWWIGQVESATTYQGILVFQARTGASTTAERLRINTSGNVGIGTTNYAGRLYVSGSSTASDSVIVGRAGVSALTAGLLDLQNSAGTSTFIVDREGNVRAGLSGAGMLLDFRSNGSNRLDLRFSDGSTWYINPDRSAGSNVSFFENTINGALALSTRNADATNTLRQGSTLQLDARYWNGSTSLVSTTSIQALIDTTAPDYRLRLLAGSGQINIRSNGNVGIGVTNPGYALDVSAAIAIRGNANADNPVLYFQANDLSNRFTVETDLDPTTTNDLLGFRSVTADNILVLRGDGNIGIGTTNPVGLLTLRGYTGGTAGSAVAAFNKTLVIGGPYNQSYNTGNSVLLHILDYSNDAGDNVYPIYVEDENNNVAFYINGGQVGSAGYAYFGTTVGIGTTASTFAPLHVYSSYPVIRLQDALDSAYVDYNTTSLKLHAGGRQLEFVAGNTQRANIESGGTMGLSGSFLPSVDNTHNLGSPAKRWANLYVANFSTTSVSASLTGSGLQNGSVLFANATGGITGSQSQFFWDNTTSRLGIGTSGASASLTVHVLNGGGTNIRIGEVFTGYAGITLNGSTSDNEYNILSRASDKNLYINRPTGQDIIFREQNGTQAVIKTGGNVGIGTPTPSARLHVQGSTTTSTPTVLIKENQAMATATATLDVQNSVGTSLFFVSGSGRVGISSVTPGTTLDVVGTFQTDKLYYSNVQTITLTTAAESWVNLATVQNLCNFEIKYKIGSTNSEEEGTIYVMGTYHNTVSGETLVKVERQTYFEHLREVKVIQTSGGLSKTIYLRVRSDTFSPTLYWRIIQSQGGGASNSGAPVTINNSDATASPPSGGLSVYVAGANVSSHNMNTMASKSFSIGGGTSYTSRLLVTGSGASSSTSTMHLLNSSGNSLLYVRDDKRVGVGTPYPLGLLTIGNPSADGTSDYTKGIVFADTLAGDVVPWAHAAIWSLGSTGFNGSLLFGTDGDGTSGASITERMRIDNNGNVGINTTSMTLKLEVSGSDARIHDVRIGRGGGSVSGNTVIGGSNALNSNTTGLANTAIGFAAGTAITTTNQNTAIGYGAFQLGTGANNTAIGSNTLRDASSGNNNTAVGVGAMLPVAGSASNNTALGYEALRSHTTGNRVVALGYRAGYGAASANANTTGSNNIYIGAETVGSAVGNTNEIVIGDAATGLGSNTTVLGNSSTVSTYLAGNVGIGTTNPAARLMVSGSSTSSSQTMLVKAGVANQTGPVLEVEDNNGATLFVVSGSSGGNVGIGTGLPSAKFEVVGVSGSLFSVTDNLSGSLFSVNTISGLPILEVFSDNTVVAGAYNTNALVVTGSRVGIGSSNPASRLDVNDTANFVRFQVGSGYTYNTHWADYHLFKNNTSVGANLALLSNSGFTPGTDNVYDIGSQALRWRNIYATSISGSLTGSNVSAGQVVVAGTGGVLSGSNNFWWDNTNRRVGIGTSTPSTSLYVYGGDFAAAMLNQNPAGYFAYSNSDTNVNFNSSGLIRLTNNNSTAGNNTPIDFYNSSGNVLARIAAINENHTTHVGSLVFATRNAGSYGERMRIDSNGNVGIGTTNPASPLQVYRSTTGTALRLQHGVISGFADLELSFNAANTSTSTNDAYIDLVSNNGTATDFVVATRSNIAMSFRTSQSERMRIDSSGNVGINTTSMSLKLEVSGSDARIHDVRVGRGPGAYASNTVVGLGALNSTTIDGGNTAIGRLAAASITGATGVTAVGYAAITYSTGTGNTAMGYAALYGVSGGSSGTNNTAIGSSAGFSNTSGGNNTSIGGLAGYSTTTGGNNFFGGYQSGYLNSVGAGNVSIGYQSLYTNTSGSNNVAIGYQSGLGLTTGNENVSIGYIAGYSLTSGTRNVLVGSAAGNAVSTSSSVTAVGYAAAYRVTTGAQVTAVGSSAIGWNTGADNTGVGYAALLGVNGGSTGANNTAIGSSAGFALTTGASNFFGGYWAGVNVTTGGNNVLVGSEAGYNVANGSRNVIIGRQAGNRGDLSDSTHVGYRAGVFLSGNRNTSLGSYALNGVDGSSTGTNNVAVGFEAGDSITTGANNVVIGTGADLAAATNSNSIVIGSGSVGLGSNTTVLGNSSTTTTYIPGNVGVGITNPGSRLHIVAPASTDAYYTAQPATAGYAAGLLFNNKDGISVGYARMAGGANELLQFAGNTTAVTNVQIGSFSATANAVVTFYTNNTERTRVDSNGHLLPGADNTYNLGSSTLRWANVFANNIVASGSLGPAYTTASSTVGSTAIFDTISVTTDAAVYELMIMGNPNALGSPAYRDIIYGKVIIGTGFGTSVRNYIQFIQESPAPRSLYGSAGGGPLTADVVYLQGGIEYTDIAQGGTATIRVKIFGYSSSTGSNTTVRLKQLM